MIDKLQNYFGIALRQDIVNIEAMNSAITASLYHVCDYHGDCPKTDDTWCLYQKDNLNRAKNYKSTGALPVDIRSAILPI